MSHNTKVRTRAEMQAEYGSVPPVSRVWTIHRAHASVTYVTDDGGDHWTKRSVLHASIRARQDELAVEHHWLARLAVVLSHITAEPDSPAMRKHARKTLDEFCDSSACSAGLEKHVRDAL